MIGDGTREIKMFTALSRQKTSSILPTTLFKLRLETDALLILKMYIVKPKAKALRHFKI